ncbi:meiotic nuclear division protein 1 [Caulochytrium protostelioides]|uniref:Meiotic nuclear division protein 1 n=1 Tax=Caulochytrium protostelioides TaxID=1555241 RepID=A0A4P9WVX3_9FUNG|nr:meiotic nuclear division protein 1 [Caulochytrium protostelioides]
MSKKKGLSFDEKRTRMLELFHETEDFWQLKDIEKMAPKQKGITPQSVKEVLDSLVSDSLVICEKIGTSNYFWSFPSEAQALRERSLEKLRKDHSDLSEQKQTLEQSLEEAKAGKEDSNDRTQVNEAVKELEATVKALTSQMERYKDRDPAYLDSQRKDVDVAIAAANRWTDNIFTVRKYVQKSFNIDGASFDQQFGIKDDFDYI